MNCSYNILTAKSLLENLHERNGEIKFSLDTYFPSENNYLRSYLVLIDGNID